MKIRKISLLSFLFLIAISCEKKNEETKEITKILFLSRRVDNSPDKYMYIMNLDGSEQKLVCDLSVNSTPVISDKYKKIAFHHISIDSDEIYTINYDGKGLQLIDKSKIECRAPDLSNMNSEIIYTKSLNDSIDGIYISDFNNHRLLLDSLHWTFYAKFTPNSEIIALIHDSELYFKRRDRTSKKELITIARDFPQWSPSGKKFAIELFGEECSSQIAIANADGSDIKQLTTSFFHNTDLGRCSYGNERPIWSPDESKIIYVSRADSGQYRIFCMNSDGSNQIRLTNFYSTNPAITPDGKKIVFNAIRNKEQDSEIYIMDIDGKNQTPITNYKDEDFSPIIIKMPY